MLTYGLALNKLKGKNAVQASLTTDKNKGNWDFAFMPQNLYLNNELGEKGFMVNNRLTGMQPVFSATCTF
jgi:hypothetical protein